MLIEPLASMAAVEDFLYPRIQRKAAQAASPRAKALLDQAVAKASLAKAEAAKEVSFLETRSNCCIWIVS